jgi:mono/diheme cytochrome c family protein
MTRRRSSPVVVMGVCVLAGALGAAQDARNSALSPRRGGNPEAAKIKNPIASTDQSIAAGRRTYGRLCVRCHGVSGKGDGGGAHAGGQPADFTDETWEFGGSDGEIFSAIREGTSADMEGYGDRLSENEIWELVNFLKSLGPRR